MGESKKFLKVQLYILGMLARFGPQHGYNLKKMLAEQVADFARIELGNTYYHLNRMHKEGWVDAAAERLGNRPARAVFSITKAGEHALEQLLVQALEEEFWSEFAVDAVLFFADRLPNGDTALKEALGRRKDKIAVQLRALRTHRDEVCPHLPPQARRNAAALFRHHELHCEAELRWLTETVDTFGDSDGNGLLKRKR